MADSGGDRPPETVARSGCVCVCDNMHVEGRLFGEKIPLLSSCPFLRVVWARRSEQCEQ